MTTAEVACLVLCVFCSALLAFVVWLHNRMTRVENRYYLLWTYYQAQKQTGPIPTPQEIQAAQEANPFYPHQPQPPIGTVWGNPWTERHRPNLPKEDKAGKERDTQERMRQTREAVPYGFRSGDEPRPIE